MLLFNMASVTDSNNGVREYSTDVSLYEKGRPDYTKESVEFLLSRVGVLPFLGKEPTKLLEIAAGTGRFTRAMVEVLTLRKANVEIIASDRLLPMCEVLRCFLPETEIRQFPADNIGKIKSQILLICIDPKQEGTIGGTGG